MEMNELLMLEKWIDTNDGELGLSKLEYELIQARNANKLPDDLNDYASSLASDSYLWGYVQGMRAAGAEPKHLEQTEQGLLFD